MRGRAEVEGTQRFGGTTPQRADELAVVVVRDLAGPVVELELLERGECPVALLGQSQPPLLECIGPSEPVISRPRLAQEGQGHEQDADDGEHSTNDERGGHTRTVAPA